LGYRRAVQRLAKTFDHAKMKKRLHGSCHEFYKAGSSPASVPLKEVAQTFGTLQQQRHIADYDNGFVWQRTDAVAQIDLAIAAFVTAWIRGTDEAQDYCWPYSFQGPRSNHVMWRSPFLGSVAAFQLLVLALVGFLDDGRLGIGVILNMIPLPLRER